MIIVNKIAFIIDIFVYRMLVRTVLGSQPLRSSLDTCVVHALWRRVYTVHVHVRVNSALHLRRGSDNTRKTIQYHTCFQLNVNTLYF